MWCCDVELTWACSPVKIRFKVPYFLLYTCCAFSWWLTVWTTQVGELAVFGWVVTVIHINQYSEVQYIYFLLVYSYKLSLRVLFWDALIPDSFIIPSAIMMMESEVRWSLVVLKSCSILLNNLSSWRLDLKYEKTTKKQMKCFKSTSKLCWISC